MIRYDKADFNSAAKAASRASEADGRLRFVMATATGYTVTLRRVPFQDCWWTNGYDCGPWKAGAPEGMKQTDIARDLAAKLARE